MIAPSPPPMFDSKGKRIPQADPVLRVAHFVGVGTWLMALAVVAWQVFA